MSECKIISKKSAANSLSYWDKKHLDLFVSNITKLIQREKYIYYSPVIVNLVAREMKGDGRMPKISEAVYFFPGNDSGQNNKMLVISGCLVHD